MKHNKDRIYTIYRSINTVNGKVYIGFDSNWPHRKNAHIRRAKTFEKKQYFQHALAKHGPDAFQWDIIYQSKDRDHTLNVMEPFFITEYKSNDGKFGYNLSIGGDGPIGCKRSEEDCRKIKERFTGRKFSDEHRKKIGEANKLRVWTEESRQKVALSLRGRKLTKEHLENIAKSSKGRIKTEETRKKLSKPRQKFNMSIEAKDKLRERNRNRFWTQEARKKIAEANKKRYSEPKGAAGSKIMFGSASASIPAFSPKVSSRVALLLSETTDASVVSGSSVIVFPESTLSA